MTEESVGLRVQRMSLTDQTLVLASIASGRSENGTFSGRAITELFYDAALPSPSKIGNVIAALGRAGLATKGKGHGDWVITPMGRHKVGSLIGEDAAGLLAEAMPATGAELGHSRHPLIPATLAPPQLVRPVAEFNLKAPSSANVFGMTRFPDDDEEPGPDPVAGALAVTDTALQTHGLRFLLASQRALVDDLWDNVSAHMWASSYGIAFFEDRRGRGMNYNLVIEVGAMLMAGRRCLLLKDSSIKRMPTDLVGKIYKSVDLDDPDTVTKAVHEWAREDLALGNCSGCSS